MPIITPTRPPASDIRLSDDRPRNLVHYLKAYARANPSAAALWCLAAGFVLGWKLKPW